MFSKPFVFSLISAALLTAWLPAQAAVPTTTAINPPAVSAPMPIMPTPIENKPTAAITIPAPAQLTPTVPVLNANGFILMDAASGQLIAIKNPDQRMAPASLTKMMTSYVISSALKQGRIHLDDLVPISQAAWQTGGSKMFVKVGTQVPVRDLMQGIIVDSGNDACVAMAEFVAGSQDAFVNLMNQEAAALGMTGTHFADVNGLPDPNHYTTPRDMSTLARHLIYDFPEDYKWYSQKWFAYNGIKQPNRNRLLWRDPSVDGVKTGHTDEAGFCLVASALRNGTRLISVVMGAPTDAARADDNETLLTYGFHFFETHKLYTAGDALNNAPVYQGLKDTVPAGINSDLYVIIPTGQYQNLKADLVLNTPIKAPVEKGQPLGNVNVSLAGKIIATAPLIALQDDPQGGLWQRMMDRIGTAVHRN